LNMDGKVSNQSSETQTKTQTHRGRQRIVTDRHFLVQIVLVRKGVLTVCSV
jgi:hypothetical protein